MSYTVDLIEGERALGAGFFLTSTYVVTAAHCLKLVTAEDAELGIITLDGTLFYGRIWGIDKARDLAVIKVDSPLEPNGLPVHHAGARSDSWASPYRPSMGDPMLSGTVLCGRLRYACRGGAFIEAMQLKLDVDYGDYHGYSGSPIEVKTGAGAGVAGVLVEQHLDRATGERAVDVVFAATLRQIIMGFDCFETTLLEALGIPLNDVLVDGRFIRARQTIVVSEDLLKMLRRAADDGNATIAEVDAVRTQVLNGLAALPFAKWPLQ